MTQRWLRGPAIPKFDHRFYGEKITAPLTVPAWYSIYDQATNLAGTGWTSILFRQIFAVAGYSGLPGTGSKVRLTASAVSAGGTMNISGAYIGHAAGAGDAWDFDGNQVQILWSGGGTVAVSAGAISLSDEISFAFDATKNIIVSLGFSASFVGRRSASLPTGFASYDLAAGSGSVGTSDVAGMGAAGYVTGMSKLEILG